MEIRQLLYFTAIAEEGSISAAAQRLHLSQPPLSRQLMLLEEELGCSLLKRDTRHMALTEAGELLYTKAREVLRQCGDIKREVADISSGRGGTAHIGVVSSISSRLLPELVMRFHSLYPNVHLEFKERDSYELSDLVRNQQLDIALVRKPFATVDLEVQPIRNEPMCAIGKKAFFTDLPEGKISLKSLMEKPLIIYHRWENILKDAAVLDPICRCEDARTATALAGSGLGIGIVPLSALPEHMDGDMEWRALSEVFLQSEICVIRPRGRYTPVAAGLFLDMISR